MSACVIGVGNDLRGDDAVGLEVARALAGDAGPALRIVECAGEPISMLAAWEGCSRAIVVDATQSGALPGVIHRIDAAAGPLPAFLSRSSTHLLGIAEAIELARALGRLPEETIVYGIEGSTFDTGAPVSDAVADAAERVVASIRREV